VAIPLSIVSTFVLLYFTNQTLNVFTLGGLALGVGRLWTIPSWNWRTSTATCHGPEPAHAVLMAAQEVAMPILVSTNHHHRRVFPRCSSWPGFGRYLFMPLALTIAFALLMSFWCREP